MTDNDNQLIEQFFQQARQMEVEDRGFSRRVMRQLPDRRPLRLSRLWSVFCITLAVVLFVALRGWENLAAGMEVFLRTAPAEHHLPMLIMVAGGLLVAGAVELGYSLPRRLLA